MRLFFLLGLSLAVFSSSAFAAQIDIYDCDGSLRLSRGVSEGESTSVRFLLEKTTENAEFVLSEVDGERNHIASTDDRRLEFPEVSAGKWKLCSKTGTNVAFSDASIIQDRAAIRGQLGITTVALAGVAGMAVASNGFGISSGSDRSGSGSQDSPPPASSSSTSPRPDVSAAVSWDDDDYEIGAPAKPLSPAS